MTTNNKVKGFEILKILKLNKQVSPVKAGEKKKKEWANLLKQKGLWNMDILC